MKLSPSVQAALHSLLLCGGQWEAVISQHGQLSLHLVAICGLLVAQVAGEALPATREPQPSAMHHHCFSATACTWGPQCTMSQQRTLGQTSVTGQHDAWPGASVCSRMGVNSTYESGGSERRCQGWAGARPSPAPQSVLLPAALQIVRRCASRVTQHQQRYKACATVRTYVDCSPPHAELQAPFCAVLPHLQLGRLTPAASVAGAQAVTRRVRLPWS